ncbi:hypothetical protein ACFFRR_002224 [Megaselia abdita]
MKIVIDDNDTNSGSEMDKNQSQLIEILDDDEKESSSDVNKENSDWSKLPSDILRSILKAFTVQELRSFAPVCKNWCQEIALFINSEMTSKNDKRDSNSVEISSDVEASSVQDCDIDLTEEDTSNANTKNTIKVRNNSFLKDDTSTTSSVIDLSDQEDVIDLCSGNRLAHPILQMIPTIITHPFSRPTRPTFMPPRLQGPIPRQPVTIINGMNLFPSFRQPMNVVYPHRLTLRQPNIANQNSIACPSNTAQQSQIRNPIPRPSNLVPETNIRNPIATSSTPSATNAQQRKRESSQSDPQISSKKSKTSLKVAIIDQNTRNGFICDQSWTLFRRQMCDAVLKYINRHPNCTDPVFFYTGLENDRRWYQCEDEFSLNFLQTTVSEMGQLWQNAKLKVDSYNNIHQRSKAEICINNPNLTAYEVTAIILAANSGMARSDILISTFKKKPNEQILILDMTQEVADLIKKKHSTMYFGFQQINVKFLPGDNEILN